MPPWCLNEEWLRKAGHPLPSADGTAGWLRRPGGDRRTPGPFLFETAEKRFVLCAETPFARGFETDEIYFMSAIDAEVASIVTALEDIYLWDGSAFLFPEQRLIYKAQEG